MKSYEVSLLLLVAMPPDRQLSRRRASSLRWRPASRQPVSLFEAKRGEITIGLRSIRQEGGGQTGPKIIIGITALPMDHNQGAHHALIFLIERIRRMISERD
jgi:hypothetical protein